MSDTAEITAIHAAQHIKRGPRWNRTLVRIETDRGVSGYGEMGTDGQTARGQIGQLESLLVGTDPLAIERTYDRLSGLQHSHRPHYPVISGIDIALWDLAGKLLDRPVSRLLTGQFRAEIPYYVNSAPEDLLDPDTCERWADELRDDPASPSTVKVSFDEVITSDESTNTAQLRRERTTLGASEYRAVGEAAANVRDALGTDRDFIAHCHNEWDLPSALGIAEAIAPAHPLWLEDPLPVEYGDAWATLESKAPCRILTGEKLEGVREFEPFMDNSAVDIVQPDLVFAGGITGCRRIARLADRHAMPVTAHNTGGLLQNAATLHFAASTRNFWMTETMLTQSESRQAMGEAPGLDVREDALGVPTGPGLGVTVDDDAIQDMLIESETAYW